MFFIFSNLWRVTSEEKRAMERAEADLYNEVRQASEVHRQVRRYVKSLMRPGLSMIELCEAVENGTRTLIEEKGLERGDLILIDYST